MVCNTLRWPTGLGWLLWMWCGWRLFCSGFVCGFVFLGGCICLFVANSLLCLCCFLYLENFPTLQNFKIILYLKLSTKPGAPLVCLYQRKLSSMFKLSLVKCHFFPTYMCLCEMFSSRELRQTLHLSMCPTVPLPKASWILGVLTSLVSSRSCKESGLQVLRGQ